MHYILNVLKKLSIFMVCMGATSSYIYPKKVIHLNKAHYVDGSLRRNFLQELIKTFHIDVVVETGTSMGTNILHAVPYFREIHAIRQPPVLYARIASQFKNNLNVRVYCGDSSTVLCQILPPVKGKILFILDSHIDKATTTRRNYTPIFQEIRAIIACGITDGVILINSTHFRDAEFPLEKYLRDAILDINSHYQIETRNNLTLAFLPA